MNAIMPLFVSVVFVVGVFAAYFVTDYRLDKKLLAPISAKLDEALLAEARKRIMDTRNKRGGILNVLIPVIFFGVIIAVMKDAGWLSVTESGRVAFIALFGVLIGGYWYAYQQHVVLDAYHEHIVKAIAWDAFAKTSGSVKFLHRENGSPLLISVSTDDGVQEFFVPQAADDEVVRDLMVGARVVICHQSGGNRAEHIVVTKLPEEEEHRRLIEEMKSMSDI